MSTDGWSELNLELEHSAKVIRSIEPEVLKHLSYTPLFNR